MKNKIVGGLMGVAVGDALGVTTEFLTPEKIQIKYGSLHTEIIGEGIINSWKKGEVSDDTDMTLCVAKGILENPNDPIPSISNEFLAWLQTKPKDVGNTIRTSYQMYRFYEDWFVAAEKAHHLLQKKSAGNGSLMRCLPIALAYNDITFIHEISTVQSKMTHYDDLAAEACRIYNTIAYELLQGADLKKVVQKEAINSRYSEILKKEPLFHPDDFVVHTFAWVLYTLLHTNSFEEAIVTAVNRGYDADTVGAITGGLAGIHYGYDSIPQRWIQEILKKDEILATGEALYTLRTHS